MTISKSTHQLAGVNPENLKDQVLHKGSKNKSPANNGFMQLVLEASSSKNSPNNSTSNSVQKSLFETLSSTQQPKATQINKDMTWSSNHKKEVSKNLPTKEIREEVQKNLLEKKTKQEIPKIKSKDLTNKDNLQNPLLKNNRTNNVLQEEKISPQKPINEEEVITFNLQTNQLPGQSTLQTGTLPNISHELKNHETQNQLKKDIDPQLDQWIQQGKVEIINLNNKTNANNSPIHSIPIMTQDPTSSPQETLQEAILPIQQEMIKEEKPLLNQLSFKNHVQETSPDKINETNENSIHNSAQTAIQQQKPLQENPQENTSTIMPLFQQQKAPQKNTSLKSEEQKLGNLSINELQKGAALTNKTTTIATQKNTATLLEKIAAIQLVKNQLKETLQKGETHLLIKLSPDDLGKIDLKLDITKDGTVVALFKSDTQETMALLKKHEAEFRQIFSDSGLNMGSSTMHFSNSEQQTPFFNVVTSQNQKNDGMTYRQEDINDTIISINNPDHFIQTATNKTLNIQV